MIPELTDTLFTVLMFISLHCFIFLLNFPDATGNIYQFIMVPSGNIGVFVPQKYTIKGSWSHETKEAMIKVGVHKLCFFMYLYSMILAFDKLLKLEKLWLKSTYTTMHKWEAETT